MSDRYNEAAYHCESDKEPDKKKSRNEREVSEEIDDVTPLLGILSQERHEPLVTQAALRTLPPSQENRQPHRRPVEHNPRVED